MKVVFLRSNPVDPDSRVEKEANSLIKAGYEVQILAWDRNTEYDCRETDLRLESGNAKIYRFGIPATYGGGIKKNLASLLKFQYQIFTWLIKNKKTYDIIHACDFDTAFTANIASKITKKKIVYDIFDYYVDAFNVPLKIKKMIKFLDHRIIDEADAVIICSEKRNEQILGTNPKRLKVIHNTPLKANQELRNLNLNSEKIKLVYVGILSEGRFLKEIINLIKNKTEYELHIGGFGEYEEFVRESAEKYNNIYFYGRIPYTKALELESNCDIMTAIYDPTIANHYYAAPNKFYEALMLGKPLIMIQNTGMADIVMQHNIGITIQYDTSELELGLELLVNRKNDWLTISKKMKELYENDYSWEEMECRLLELYKEIE